MNWKKLTWKMVSLIGFGFLVFIWLIKAPVTSWYLTNLMNVRVSIAAISIWPTETTVRHFTIHNPSRFKDRKAFTAEKILIKYQSKKVIADHSELDLVQMSNVQLFIDCSPPACTSNNWTVIGTGMPKKERAKSGGTAIEKIVITDLTVEIKGIELLNATGAVNIPEKQHFDRIELDHVNSEEGFPTAQLIKKIFNQTGLSEYIDGAFDLPATVIKNALSPILGEL